MPAVGTTYPYDLYTHCGPEHATSAVEFARRLITASANTRVPVCRPGRAAARLARAQTSPPGVLTLDATESQSVQRWSR